MGLSDFTELDAVGPALLALARRALEAAVCEAGPFQPETMTLSSILQQPGACFVTLRIGASLRGCLGTLEPQRSLAEDIWMNTRAAALADPRFRPVVTEELSTIRIAVSVLTLPEPFPVHSHGDLLSKLAPGRDGLVVRDAGRRATFLPSVWKGLDSPQAFVDALWRKAGFSPGFWSDSMVLERYRAREFNEPGQEVD